MDGALYLTDITARFRELQKQCDRALSQVPYERWSDRLDPGSNSLVTLMLHLSGNMLSRWTAFLTSDGEKPDRDRDAEFEDPEGLSREALLERWARGWAVLFEAIEGLTETDLESSILIRGQKHSVIEAIHRQLAHYALHTGQILFLAKHLAGASWQTQSIARGASGQFNAAMAKPNA